MYIFGQVWATNFDIGKFLHPVHKVEDGTRCKGIGDQGTFD